MGINFGWKDARHGAPEFEILIGIQQMVIEQISESFFLTDFLSRLRNTLPFFFQHAQILADKLLDRFIR